jgi:hypothetical protein
MQTKDELLDRYHSHTELCASCRGALQNIDRIRTVCIVLILLSFVLGLSLPRVGVTIGLLGFALWCGLGELRTKFYRGRAIPPRNR